VPMVGPVIKRITIRIILKYTLFQMPEVLLFAAALTVAGRWMTIPPWFFWGFLFFLLVKNIAIFPFVWRAYDSRDAKRLHQLIGKKGVVVEPLHPQGVVRVNGELWKAEVSDKTVQVNQDEPIRVEDVRGFCLIVAKNGSGI